MTVAQFFRQLVDELVARGWNAVLHGPEAHLVLPGIGGVILAGAVWRILKGGRKQ